VYVYCTGLKKLILLGRLIVSLYFPLQDNKACLAAADAVLGGLVTLANAGVAGGVTPPNARLAREALTQYMADMRTSTASAVYALQQLRKYCSSMDTLLSAMYMHELAMLFRNGCPPRVCESAVGDDGLLQHAGVAAYIAALTAVLPPITVAAELFRAVEGSDVPVLLAAAIIAVLVGMGAEVVASVREGVVAVVATALAEASLEKVGLGVQLAQSACSVRHCFESYAIWFGATFVNEVSVAYVHRYPLLIDVYIYTFNRREERQARPFWHREIFMGG
jgi:hypothetical protein